MPVSRNRRKSSKGNHRKAHMAGHPFDRQATKYRDNRRVKGQQGFVPAALDGYKQDALLPFLPQKEQMDQIREQMEKSGAVV